MLKQLEQITSRKVLEQAKVVLMSQVILLEMQNTILWKRQDNGTLSATVSLGLPGGEPSETPISFYFEQPENRTEPVYYLKVGTGADEICRNSFDDTIAELARKRFE